MKNSLLFFLCTWILAAGSLAQQSSLILLGDLHYDRMENHHMDWLDDKPDDLKQVLEYTKITEEHWEDFMTVIRKKAGCEDFPAICLNSG
jgi:hypothetical protein